MMNTKTGLLNFEEHFSSFDESYEEPDYQSSPDDNRGYFNDWEDERELNGDIGLIPVLSNLSQPLSDMSEFTNSPPSVLYQKMADWSSFISVDGVDIFPLEAINSPAPEQEYVEVEQKTSDLNNTFDGRDVRNFDLASYIDESADNVKFKRKVKSVGKRIDKEAKRYIIEDQNEKLDTSDEIDVETVFEGASLPVLEANDAFSLLEQFEASEKPNVKSSTNLSNVSSLDFSNSLVNNMEIEVNPISTSPIKILEKVPPINIFEEDVKAELLTDNEDKVLKPVKKSKDTSVKDESRLDSIKLEDTKEKQEVKSQKVQSSELNNPQTYERNTQIRAVLPQDLIARINESGKRKPIPVIPPMPNKKRSASRSIDNASQHRNKIQKTSNEQIQLDHDYCAAISPYPKEPPRDSGFQSSSGEEEDRSVIRNQPTVKTADGKLMVSLLKVNTIRNDNSQKKKLNLEEYKKRRFINSNTTSLSSSPSNSTCGSPLPEDENAKRQKQYERLQKMAEELLNTPAKNAKAQPAGKNFVETTPQKVPVVPEKIVPPPDLEVKTYVSIATNTEVSSINCSKSIVASTQQLEEIKPLLKSTDKINRNSLITSLIENIPKVKTKMSSYVKPEDQEVVREDKVIQYMKKDRVPTKTYNVGTQTDFDVVVVDDDDDDDDDEDDDTQSRYRRRIDEHRSSRSSSSSSSSRSSRHGRRRSSSNSSRYSSSSSSSDSSSYSSRSSRSRSRSISPKRRRQYNNAEHLKEVEERRVIYVGGIINGTTKDDLRRRFMPFGPITNVSLHFRDYGDNYGFVTFANKEDAYDAVEHGNDHAYPKYDLSFGGRRLFCKTTYSDLDNMREDDYSYYMNRAPESSFDALLRAAQEKIRRRKS